MSISQTNSSSSKELDHISIINGVIYRPRVGEIYAYDSNNDQWQESSLNENT
jgi:hypothetical protein